MVMAGSHGIEWAVGLASVNDGLEYLSYGPSR
jgi:hypothetical protein